MVNQGVAELGRLDIVLANAGISSPAPTLEMDELVWNETIDINLTGRGRRSGPRCRTSSPAAGAGPW